MNTIIKKLVISYFLGIIFIISAILKLIDISSFIINVAQFLDVYIGIWSIKFKNVIAVLICGVELSIGIFILFEKFRKMANTLMVLLLTFFVILTGVNYFFPPQAGAVESCGCFGSLLTFSPLASFLKSVFLLFMSVTNLHINETNSK